MIDGWLDDVEKPYTNLQACRPKPYVLDHDTVGRIIEVSSAQADDVRRYKAQLSRWKPLNLTPSPRQEVHWLSEQRPTMTERIPVILVLAEGLKGGTIEIIVANSDFDLGLEWLLGTRQR
jgi:hypothetical protein